MVFQIQVAPMMGYTNRHFRYLLHLIAPNAVLFTEMISTTALAYGCPERQLKTFPHESNTICQLGGRDPESLYRSTQMVADYGYKEVNLNVGCPSSRVQQGGIGACLMKEPSRVVDCILAMKEASPLPVSVKTRIGVDEQDSESQFLSFIERCFGAGVDSIQIHARKAWLKGLNPKQNRSVPTLNYERVIHAKSQFPEKKLIINGGIHCLDQVLAFKSQGLDGVMLGRWMINNPLALSDISLALNSKHSLSRDCNISVIQLIRSYARHIYTEWKEGQASPSFLIKPLQHLITNQPGARHWRVYCQTLSQTPTLLTNLESLTESLLKNCPKTVGENIN